MIFEIDDTTQVDTDDDLSPEERHIVQKLLCWKLVADSMEVFREKTAAALHVGWNNSGPVEASPALELVIKKLEAEVKLRLQSSVQK